MDAIIKELESKIQIAFMAGSTMVHVDKFQALFILDRLKEIRDKWYEGGEVDESNDKSTDEGQNK